ncbi:MAG: four helix bundle protein, partial [SAR324 cluster bacterium]|nr:four helix bundle protein [SAR324 cluster bacterium]
SVDLYQTFLNLKDYGFKDQITRTGHSATSNTAESWEHDSLKESLQFLSHTKIPMENYEHKYTLE